MEFVKDDFRAFKAVTKVHLGAIGENLEAGEVVLFDGSVLRRGGQDHAFPALRGAIKVGWLVPNENANATYTPKPAELQVGDAVSRGEKRVMKVHKVVVDSDEQDVGDLQQVRGSDAPTTHMAKNAGQQNTTADGIVIAKLKTPAKSGPIEVGVDDRRVVTELDNKSRVAMEKIPVAVVGNDLIEILDDAAETGKPSPGVAGEGRGDESEIRAKAMFSSGSSRIGGAEDGVLVKTVQKVTEDLPRITMTTPVSSQELADRIQSQIDVLQARISDLTKQITEVLERLPRRAPAILEKESPSDGDSDTDMPDEWDMSIHWKARAKKAVDLYGGDPDQLAVIRDIETPAVNKAIDQMLAARHHVSPAI